jgi:hypothetical protein
MIPRNIIGVSIPYGGLFEESAISPAQNIGCELRQTQYDGASTARDYPAMYTLVPSPSVDTLRLDTDRTLLILLSTSLDCMSKAMVSRFRWQHRLVTMHTTDNDGMDNKT